MGIGWFKENCSAPVAPLATALLMSDLEFEGLIIDQTPPALGHEKAGKPTFAPPPSELANRTAGARGD